jgi:2-aminobenzoate-CoA ligase
MSGTDHPDHPYTAHSYTAHQDLFARDNLPPRAQWPDFINLDRLGYPERMNCAAELLDAQVAAGFADGPCLRSERGDWSYRELQENANRVARVLVRDLGMVPGERVLLAAPNNPMMVASWFGVVKAGGVAVAAMPLLRAKELRTIADKAKVRLALCDASLRDEVERAAAGSDTLGRVHYFYGGDLESLMAKQPPDFEAVETAADDVCLIAFTSGTTGSPKGTVHFHRDVLAICDTFSREVLRPEPDDLFIGSPPIAFTFGLGGLVLFPMRVGASSYLLEKPSPPKLAAAIERSGATVSFTSPTAYRMMLDSGCDLSSLKKCVSAGETLPKATWDAWFNETGLKLIDGIGATEMLHIFISAAEGDIRPGATGKPVPGYEAKVVDDEGRELSPGQVGRLAVRGPTGCRYLADERQLAYVQGGWNLTGDLYERDEDGYFHYRSRADDMIVSAGYNISGPEVEDALLTHPAVSECAVVGAPDPIRGQIPKAYVVLKDGVLKDGRAGSDALVKRLQEHVKATIAPYKYPRAIAFVDSLPRTQTGKVQRFRLRERAAEDAP